MDKKQLDNLTARLYFNFMSGMGFGGESYEIERLGEIVRMTVATITDTASVPEQVFAQDLIEHVLRREKNFSLGVFSDEEVAEFSEEGLDFGLEVFFNPTNLFFSGKIRPDVVFRKNGKYLIFEVDSFMYHSSQEALKKDKVRERKIQALGCPVYRFSAKEVTDSGVRAPHIQEALDALERHGFIDKEINHGEK